MPASRCALVAAYLGRARLFHQVCIHVTCCHALPSHSKPTPVANYARASPLAPQQAGLGGCPRFLRVYTLTPA